MNIYFLFVKANFGGGGLNNILTNINNCLRYYIRAETIVAFYSAISPYFLTDFLIELIVIIF